MLHQMDPEKLRMYPDPEIKMLTECLASRYQVRPEQVFVGVGSDDVLAMSFLTFFNSGKPVLFPDITYSFTRYGPSFTGFRIHARLWMEPCTSEQKTIAEKTAALSLRIPTHLQDCMRVSM